MPQMSPMNWLILYIFFMLLYFLVMLMIYFFYLNLFNNMSENINVNSLNKYNLIW